MYKVDNQNFPGGYDKFNNFYSIQRSLRFN